MSKKIVTLAGDGIGPEIMAAGLEVLEAVADKIGFDYDIDANLLVVQGLTLAVIPYQKIHWMLPKLRMLFC